MMNVHVTCVQDPPPPPLVIKLTLKQITIFLKGGKQQVARPHSMLVNKQVQEFLTVFPVSCESLVPSDSAESHSQAAQLRIKAPKIILYPGMRQFSPKYGLLEWRVK